MQGLVLMPLVDHAQAGSGRELGPVGGPGQPLEVVAQELVAGGAAVHERVGDDGGGVADRVADRLLGLLEDEHVGVVVADEELQVEGDGHLATQDGGQLFDALLVLLLVFSLREG